MNYDTKGDIEDEEHLSPKRQDRLSTCVSHIAIIAILHRASACFILGRAAGGE